MAAMSSLLLLLIPLAMAHMIYRDEIPNSVNIERTSAVGHVKKKGGGVLNSFGADFKRLGFTWTRELCEMDSDGDGKTNGEELGDPCCLWRPGLPLPRVWGISHPGDPYETTTTVTGECTAGQVDASGGPAEDDAAFWRFYYTTDTESRQELSPETVAKEAALLKSSLVPRVCDERQCSKCASVTCGNCPDTQQAEGPLRSFQRGCDKLQIRHDFNSEGPTKGSFGGSCTDCHLGANGTLACRCLDDNKALAWSVCLAELCPKSRLGNRNGKLACSTGLNYCLATPNQRDLLDVLEAADPATLIAGLHSTTIVRTAYKGGKLGGQVSNSPLLAFSHSIASIITLGFFSYFAHRDCDTLLNPHKILSRDFLMLCLASVVYVDVLSGLLHITLDNPTITHWPLLGPECEAFQGHHVSPNDITRGSWLGHLSEAHFVHALLSLSALGSLGDRHLRLFLFVSNFSATWMMAAHRWAHTNPAVCPWWVLAMQKTGLLVSHSSHSQHHSTYTENFAIFTGWSNPIINMASKHLMHPYNPVWVVLFFLCLLMPLLVSRVANCQRIRLKKHVS